MLAALHAAVTGKTTPRTRTHSNTHHTTHHNTHIRRYPPTLDAELDGADAGLSTLKTQSLEGPSAEGGVEGQQNGEEADEEEEHRVLPSTKEERREAKKKLKEDEKKLKVRCGLVGRNKKIYHVNNIYYSYNAKQKLGEERSRRRRGAVQRAMRRNLGQNTKRTNL